MLYVKSQKGVMPMSVKDMARLNAKTVQLWNGEKWTQLLGVSKSARSGNEIEIVLRSGERISCTPTHRFPTTRGLLSASELHIGDCLQSVQLPDTDNPRDCAIDDDAAWLAGLYIAEGSRSDDCIQITGHAKETLRLERCKQIATKYGGYITSSVDGNKQSIRLYGKILLAILDELVSGRTAKDKCFATVVWRYSNQFIASMLDGYLSGDGSWDEKNKRWRLGFTRNYNLERDIRTACARLGYHLVLNLGSVLYDGKQVPTFRGEIRKGHSNHRNCKNATEIVGIRKARCRYVYDLSVEDEPHVFALASGVLTHNSKPNPMPESVKDRCTKSHEYIFLLSKSARYYYDSEAIMEVATGYDGRKDTMMKGSAKYANGFVPSESAQTLAVKGHERWPNSLQTGKTGEAHSGYLNPDGSLRVGMKDGIPARNKRDVWTVTTKPYKGAHFAVMPEKLVEPCVLAGSRPGDTVLDPFSGAGTVGVVAVRLGRGYIGIELNPEYIELSKQRINGLQMEMDVI